MQLFIKINSIYSWHNYGIILTVNGYTYSVSDGTFQAHICAIISSATGGIVWTAYVGIIWCVRDAIICNAYDGMI